MKFEVLAQAASPDDSSLLDVGCGFADFEAHLRRNGYTGSYKGIDLSPKMIEEARRLNPHLDLSSGNVLDRSEEEAYDVVVANGIFYLLGADAASLMETLVRKMFSLTRRALAFNSLSAWAGDPEENEFHADPLRVVDLCRSLSARVVLRHDYHPRDFTIYLYRQ